VFYFNDKSACFEFSYQICINSFSLIFSGIFCELDGKQKNLYRRIDQSKPLWAVIDVHGCISGRELKLFNQIYDNHASRQYLSIEII
jgi:hypothetical protein